MTHAPGEGERKKGNFMTSTPKGGDGKKEEPADSGEVSRKLL